MSSGLTPSGTRKSRRTLTSPGPSSTPPTTALPPAASYAAMSLAPMALTAAATAPICFPSRRPSACQSGSARRVAYLVGSAHVSRLRTFSSEHTYSASSPFMSSRNSASVCTTTSVLSGNLSGLFLRSRMVRASSTTRCMRSTLFWMRSSPSRAAAAAGKAQKCTDGGAAASSSGRHRRRFRYIFSVRNGVKGAMTLQTDNSTSKSDASALRESSGPPEPFMRLRL
mmetsp:Transcript_34356/g.102079  ORF Transcript_34356/g.102079 Transcript_34356/m.102079 type:complete len:226 (-) Transcript_34356:2543-3220(-)